MRLEPVYLVAPKPKPPSMPTRRAMMIASCTFAAGGLLGGACGYSLGAGGKPVEAAAPQSERPEPVPPKLEPSGDAELDQLRRFAVEASDAELIEKAPAFLVAQLNDYKRDAVLWYGVERLASVIIANPHSVGDHRIISLVIENVQVLESPATMNLRERIPALQACRDAVRQRK